MKLKTKLFIGAIGGLAIVATPAALLASCSTEPEKSHSAPTSIKQAGLQAFEGTTANPTTTLPANKISAEQLTVSLQASSANNGFLGITLPTSLSQFEGQKGFTAAATITWAQSTEQGQSEKFEIASGKLINKSTLVGSSPIQAKVIGTVSQKITIDGKEETKTDSFTLNVRFIPFADSPTPEKPTTKPNAITKEGLTANEGTTKETATTPLNLETQAEVSGLQITLTTTANTNKFIKFTLPTKLGSTFTGQTGFGDAATIAWTLKTDSETNFEFSNNVLVNKADLPANPTSVDATLTGTITEQGKQTQTFEIVVKFVLKA